MRTAPHKTRRGLPPPAPPADSKPKGNRRNTGNK